MNISRINKLIQSSKIGKGEIAERCDISRTTLDNLLSGADVKLSTVEKLALALEVPASSFFEEGTSGSAIASGKNSIAAVNSTLGERDNESLNEKMKLLQEIIDEKERLIQFLLKSQNK